MDLAGEEEEGSEHEEEENRTGEVRVVHDVLVDVFERVQDRECLIGSRELAMFI